MKLLSVNADAKTVKGLKKGYLTGILYLAPNTLSGRNVCPDATPGCITTCLNTVGRGAFNSVQRARIAKTKLLRSDYGGFLVDLESEIGALVRKAEREYMIPLVRLNGTSDLPWENMLKMGRDFPGMRFYDYTKSVNRMLRFLAGNWPANYHLTFSRSECNETVCSSILHAGGTVAVVFDTRRGKRLPFRWKGFPVKDGDLSDVRILDKPGTVIGLRAKGKARYDTSGFVVHV